MEKILIAAIASNRVIGSEGKLPWKISEDLKHFKELTIGNSIIMGRKTWDSIGFGLPQRTSIIVSNSLKGQPYLDATVVNSLEDAFKVAEEEKDWREKAYIIGGAQIYEQALPLVDKLEITHFYEEFEGDTHFPEVNWDEWAKVKTDSWEKFEFATYVRRDKK